MDGPYTVCDLCLRSRPAEYQLISLKCARIWEHEGSNRLVRAVWNPVEGRLQAVTSVSGGGVRPMPRVFFGGGFRLCDRGNRCRGERCTHAHSVEEQRAWNAQKFGTAPVQRPRQSLPPSTTMEPEWPSLPSQQQHTAMAAGPKPSAWVQPVQKPKPFPPSNQQQHTPQFPPPRISRNFTAPGATFTPLPHPSRNRYASFPSADRSTTHNQQQYGAAVVSPPANVFKQRHFPMPQQPPRQYEQQPSPLGPMLWPEFHQPAFGSRFDPYGEASTPNPAPLLPTAAPAPPPSYQPSGRPVMRVVKQQSFPSFPSVPSQYRPTDVALQSLTSLNYKAKFLALLGAEEISHGEILAQKCNGSYTLQLPQAGVKRPEWMRRDAMPRHQRWGYFLGLDGDKIAYAAQASEGLVVLHNAKPLCNADILPENFSHTEERLYIALDLPNVVKLEHSALQLTRGSFRCSGLYVKFELKHSYFTRLKDSVKKFPDNIIQKIMPEASSFAAHPIRIDEECLRRCQLFCSQDQAKALFTIARCPADGPPILIAGAFGTGKTRLLAVASNYFFQEFNKCNLPARVLVCTQQWVSAESFLKCYINDLMFERKEDEICIIRGTGYGSGYHTERSPLSRFYKTTRDFQARLERSSYQHQSNYLIITTCQTALSLSKACPPGFFTHILLDEGAQTREPEAIAPLSMATPNTKIVIAGDKSQVGPSMLVLGAKAHENGLATSLLERLERRYEKLGGTAVHYRAQLATNYRCHPEILDVGSLFYDSPLKSASDHSPAAHPDSLYPLTFVCSSIDSTAEEVRDSLNEAEADIVLREVARFAKNWPNALWGEKDLSRFCVMSPSRGQLTVINQLMGKKRLPSKLKSISRYPTYDIQGREFRALFLSTSEPTDANCSTKNPTKSLCDRYVFNTALTRAQSLVVSVGNPFLLLKMEQHMIDRYKEKGKCWSHYLKRCLDHNTLTVPTVPQRQQEHVLQQLRQLVDERLGIAYLEPRIQPAMEPQVLAMEPHSLTELAVGRAARPPTRAHDAPPLVTRSRAKVKAKASARLQQQQQQQQQQPPSPNQPRTDSGSAIPIQESAHHPESMLPKLQAQESHGQEIAGPGAFAPQNRSCNFEFKQRLGKGGFGVVFQVTHKPVNQPYAIKVIPLDRQSKMDKVMREVQALASLDHPHVVRYYGYWEECAPEGWASSREEPWSELRSLQSLVGSAEHSPLLALRHNVGGSSAPHSTPSTAHTPSSSNEVLLTPAGMADEISDSLVTFRNGQSTSAPGKESVQLAATSTAPHYFPPPLPPPMCLFIQTELCRRDTLRTWLLSNLRERRKKMVLSYFEQILAALCHIHSKSLVHRDLKPSNIFFSCAEEAKLKVGDFGLATVCAAVDPGTLMSDSSQQRSASSVAGTLPYMSPEQRAGRQCDAKTDIYSLGVIFFEMLCPCKTEMEKAEVLKNLQQKMKFPSVFKNSFPVETDFIQLLLAKKQNRPSALDIQESDHLKRIKKKNKKAKQPFVPVL